jgi:hypothetical protein
VSCNIRNRFLSRSYSGKEGDLDGSVGIVAGYGLDGGCSIPDSARSFSLLHSVKTGS